MKVLADQDIYAATVALLRSQNHDVVTAAERGLSQASDLVVLQAAIQEDRVLLTRDRDFGALVFGGNVKGGVIYLRITPSALQAVHNELLRVLARYGEDELRLALVVVEASRHRIRHIKP